MRRRPSGPCAAACACTTLHRARIAHVVQGIADHGYVGAATTFYIRLPIAGRHGRRCPDRTPTDALARSRRLIPAGRLAELPVLAT